ncbi:MAG: DUF493 domain-containing protein [Candidatus Theseobacter exili]|jgi:uncharacterized protein|nr:DUF493 domain-containing protein [Candidatus Theseobacter exili]
MNKPKIDYPCKWAYKIIGQDEKLLKQAAVSVVGNNLYTITASKSSSGGKYKSLKLEVDVRDENERINIFERLKRNSAIKFVL